MPFGKYQGAGNEQALRSTNPFYAKQAVSLKPKGVVRDPRTSAPV